MASREITNKCTFFQAARAKLKIKKDGFKSDKINSQLLFNELPTYTTQKLMRLTKFFFF
jgi:hypothetical protein